MSDKRTAGSPTAGEPAYIAIGKVRRPHGVAGEAVVELYTDFPGRLHPDAVVYAGEKHIPLTIRDSRHHNEGLILAFYDISIPEDIGRYRNHVLYVTASERQSLPEGEYYHDELLGLYVVDEFGNSLGILTDILLTGANDVYVVKDAQGGEILLPAIAEVVLDVDLALKAMKVHLIPGLVE